MQGLKDHPVRSVEVGMRPSGIMHTRGGEYFNAIPARLPHTYGRPAPSEARDGCGGTFRRVWSQKWKGVDPKLNGAVNLNTLALGEPSTFI